MSDIAPQGVDRLKLCVTVPARLRAQKQGPVGAEDVLKFIVSTFSVRGTKSLELPDLWDAVEHNVAAVRSADETFGALVRETLVETSKGPGQLGGEKPMIKFEFEKEPNELLAQPKKTKKKHLALPAPPKKTKPRDKKAKNKDGDRRVLLLSVVVYVQVHT